MNDNRNWRELYKRLGTSRSELIADMAKRYQQGLSAIEISEQLFREKGVILSPRSIQRNLKGIVLMRSSKESYRLAIKKGRVKWKKSNKPKFVRVRLSWSIKYSIGCRDKWTCQGCGFHHQDDSFQHVVIDHIVPISLGGENEEKNLQVLCVACHAKKTIDDRKRILDIGGQVWERGGCYSGRDHELRKQI